MWAHLDMNLQLVVVHFAFEIPQSQVNFQVVDTLEVGHSLRGHTPKEQMELKKKQKKTKHLTPSERVIDLLQRTGSLTLIHQAGTVYTN